MTALQRWLRFNAVGLLGVGVQLSLVSLFHHGLRLSAACSAALAVELTLLHNFAWHRRFTWNDAAATPWPAQLLRFHLGNGLVSLTGNALLTPLLVNHGVPLLAANATAIALCATANFLLASRWIFTTRFPPGLKPRPFHADA